MIKLLREIFPQGKKGWLKYFDWCGYRSYVFKPIAKKKMEERQND